MMSHAFPWFVTPCLEAFSYLQSRFRFDTPVVEQLGRECFIYYRKADRWVSIAYEPGSVPIVELFHPKRDIRHRRMSKQKLLQATARWLSLLVAIIASHARAR